jgi:hypothetical protein
MSLETAGDRLAMTTDRVRRKIWVAIPAYTAQVHVHTMMSLLRDVCALRDRGDEVEVSYEAGNPMLALCRAQIMGRFMADVDATDLFYVDSDVCWEAGAMLRLIDHPVDFVGAAYPGRSDPEHYKVRLLPLRQPEPDQQTGLIEVRAVPGGFMRLRRSVIERMAAHYPELAFRRHEDPPCWNLFCTNLTNRETVPFPDDTHFEDMAFNRRWRELGGKAWIDPAVRMGHTGLKTFIGCLGDWLRSGFGGRTNVGTP